MINILTGGHYQKKGYYYRLYITFPDIGSHTITNIYGDKHKSSKVSFPTQIRLTTSNVYYNIVGILFGFGLGLEIQSKTRS